MNESERLSRTFGAAEVTADERRDLIRRTFREVAPRYDLMNDLMSMGVHRLWKAGFVDLAGAACPAVAPSERFRIASETPPRDDAAPAEPAQ